MSSAPLSGRLFAHLAESRLFEGGGLAVLAVSGGPDSLAMLDLLAGLGAELGLSFLVAHADHGIHPESPAVASRVAELARSRYGIETVVGTLSLGPGAGETRSRIARYRFLRQVQQERGGRYLVTAHHADDQIETVLLRLLRGSAPAGLAGIPATGPHGLVRPLLPFRRAELASHAAERSLPVFLDPANADPRHMRSWVRTSLLPLLERRLGEHAAEHLLSVTAHAANEVAAWDAVVDQLAGLDSHSSDGCFDVAREALRGYHNALAARVLRAAGRRSGIALGPLWASRLARFGVEAKSGRRLQIGAALVAEVAFDRLVVRRLDGAPEAWPMEGSEGEGRFGRHSVHWRMEQAPTRIERGGWTTWVLPGALVVRSPERGDRLGPLGGVGKRRLSRLLMEARVPRGERFSYPVLERDGEPVWLPGICRGEAAVPEPGVRSVRIDVAAG